MAGVKKFDQEEIIDRALEVFWQQGYEATSIHDLVEATGIGSGSLYGTFGDKEKLFLAVLDRYSEKSAATFMNALNDPNPRRALEGMFEQLIERMSNPGYKNESKAHAL
jgi:TetR/AcrR family transcriptional repressor of nem operon